MTDGRDSFVEEIPSSVVPTTIGGMLAEEWTINPHSPMPSFLERVFMQEAQDSSYKGLETAFDTLLAYCERLVLSLAVRSQASSGSGNVTESSAATRLLDRGRQILRYLFRLASSVMRRHRLKILFISIYAIERASLERSSCTLAESFYGGHRVKLSPTTRDGKPRRATPLETRDKVRLATILAFSFLARKRLEELYRRWRGNEQAFLTMEQRLFLVSYPWIRMCYQSVAFLCKWNYLLGTTPFFDVPSVLLQQWVRRVSREDSFSSSSNGDTPTPRPTANNSPAETPDDQSRLLVQGASIVATGSAAISWLTWCRSTWSDLSREHDKSKTTITPPPPPTTTRATVKTGSCSLCGAHPPERPTACTVSGVCWM